MQSWSGLAGLLLLWSAALAAFLTMGGFAAAFLLYGLSVLSAYALMSPLLSIRSVRVSRKVSADQLLAGRELTVEVEISYRTWLPVAWLAVRDGLVPDEADTAGGTSAAHRGSMAAAGGRAWLSRKTWRRERRGEGAHKPARSVDPHHFGGGGRVGAGVYAFWRLSFPGLRTVHRFRYTVKGLGRGVYRFSRLELRTGDLFGFLRYCLHPDMRTEQPSLITVVPQPLMIPGRLFARGLFTGERPVPAVYIPGQRSGSGVRDYVRGDAPQRIDWKATAKRGRLQSREQEAVLSDRAVVFLDGAAESYAAPGCGGLYETAVRTTAGLQQLAWARQEPIGLACSGQRPLILPAAREWQLPQLLARLAGIRCDGSEPFADFLARRAAALAAEQAVIAVTALPTEPLLATADRLRRMRRTVLLIFTVPAGLMPEMEREWAPRFAGIGCGTVFVPHAEAREEVAADVADASA